MNLRKFFLYLLIVSVVLSALIGIGVVLFGDFGEFETRILLTALTITCTSILGLACGAYFESKRGRVLPLSGIALSIISAVIGTIIIWSSHLTSKYVAETGMSTTLLAIACAHLCLISLARLDARFRWTYYVAFTADSMLMAILLFIIWFDPNSDSMLVSRAIGVLSIVIASLTIMTPVFHKLSSVQKTEIESVDEEISRLKSRIEELERRKAELA